MWNIYSKLETEKKQRHMQTISTMYSSLAVLCKYLPIWHRVIECLVSARHCAQHYVRILMTKSESLSSWGLQSICEMDPKETHK